MTDIALVLGQDGGSADLAIVHGDFLLDDGLQTAIMLSLMTNRRADPEDDLPPGQNAGGWWGDAYLPPLPDGAPDFYGSKLWLRRRVLATQESANLLQADILAALDWLIVDGVATNVACTTSWNSGTALAIATTITQLASPGSVPASRTYNLIWDKTLGVVALA